MPPHRNHAEQVRRSREKMARQLAPHVRPEDTAITLAARIGLGAKYVALVMTEGRRLGIMPPAPRGVAKAIPAAPGVQEMSTRAAASTEVAPEPATEPDPGMTETDLGGGEREMVSVDSYITTPEELVEASGLDLTVWEIVESGVNSWGSASKNADGQPVVTRLWQVKIRIRPRAVPLVACDWPAPPVFHIPESERDPTLRRAVVLPDMQIGFEWDLDGTPHLDPYHDRRAIDVALQIIAREQPTDVVLLGDNLDFAALSVKYAVGPSQRQTSRPAITELRWLLYRIREVAPSARILYTFGNHEARWDIYLEAMAGELAPMVPTLADHLHLDQLGIEWVRYTDQLWLWNRIRVIHGETVRQTAGATAAAVLAKETHPVVYGHIHRAEIGYRRITGPTGASFLWAMSPGCLCRLDGRVRGSTPRSDWAQGVGIITAASGLPDAVEVVRITDGRALHHGDLLTGRDYVAEMAGATSNAAYLVRAT